MSAIPLGIAVPAAAASLAYLNARWQLGTDYHFLRALIANGRDRTGLEKRDRVNFFYRLEEHAQAKATATHPFLVYDGRTWTYRETYDQVLKYAAWLKTKYSVAPNETIAVDLMNSAHFVFLLLALWSLGALPAFINYNLTDHALVHCVRITNARVIISEEEVRPKFTDEVLKAFGEAAEGQPVVETIFFDPSAEQEIEAYQPHREPDLSRSGAVGASKAILIFTSGTTGLPKAGIVGWQKMIGGTAVLRNWMGLNRSHRFYSCMPLYHATATVLGLAPCLIEGSTFVIGRKFSNRTFWPEVRASKATIIQYVGETCRYLLAAPPQIDPSTGANLDKVNDVQIAFGNGLRPDIWNRFKERFGIETIAEFYGATEGAGASWNLSSNDFSAGAIGHVGKLFGYLIAAAQTIVELDFETEQPIRDPKNHDFCRRAPSNVPGELLYKLDPANVTGAYMGYYNNEKASTSKLMRDVYVKGDLYFRSGDVMRRDSENRVWFCDRIGDTFRWKSENVSTAEVAEVLGRYPAVVDANVYGVELPNHDGRAGCVAVVLEREADEKLLRELAEWVSSRLPRYAVPLFVRVGKEVTATGNNKQQKHVLRNEGADPGKMGKDRIFWLRDGAYVPFTSKDWTTIQEGYIRL
ncbi:hypothetical protein MMC25_004771 [Agyrium rufum]|nr:hypothetical protein [Agyrium rufum]